MVQLSIKKVARYIPCDIDRLFRLYMMGLSKAVINHIKTVAIEGYLWCFYVIFDEIK